MGRVPGDPRPDPPGQFAAYLYYMIPFRSCSDTSLAGSPRHDITNVDIEPLTQSIGTLFAGGKAHIYIPRTVNAFRH
jgi:hypothetical protein